MLDAGPWHLAGEGERLEPEPGTVETGEWRVEAGRMRIDNISEYTPSIQRFESIEYSCSNAGAGVYSMFTVFGYIKVFDPPITTIKARDR